MPVLPAGAVPALPFIALGKNGTAELTGTRCAACQAVVPGSRRACAACGSREISAVALNNHGSVRQYTVVHRSYPGVPTPFVAAVVDLDGGGSLQGTLVDIAPDPVAIPFGLRVDVVFRDTGQRAPDGAPFVGYVFQPATGAAA